MSLEEIRTETSLPKITVPRDIFGLLTGSEVVDAGITAVCLFVIGFLIHDIAERLLANRKHADEVSYFSLARILVLRDWTTRKIDWTESKAQNGDRYKERNHKMRSLTTALGIFMLFADFGVIIIGLPSQRITYFEAGKVPVVRIGIPSRADIALYKSRRCQVDNLVQDHRFSDPSTRSSCGIVRVTCVRIERNITIPEPGQSEAIVVVLKPEKGKPPVLLLQIRLPDRTENVAMIETVRWETEEGNMPFVFDSNMFTQLEELVGYWGRAIGFSIEKLGTQSRLGVWRVRYNTTNRITLVQELAVTESVRAAIRAGMTLEVQDGVLTNANGTEYTSGIEIGRHAGTIITTLGAIILTTILLVLWAVVRILGFRSQEWHGWWLLQTFGRRTNDNFLAGPNEHRKIFEDVQSDGSARLVYKPIDPENSGN